MINYWMSASDIEVAEWLIRFQEDTVDLHRMMTLIRETVDASAKQQICMIKSANLLTAHDFTELPDFVYSDDYGYVDFAEDIVREYAFLPLFPCYDIPSRRDSSQSLICFYKNRKLVSKTTDN
ncbi:MAG: hypothetical protein AAFR67_02555, partial [Chloroflexota bacterium]